MTLIFIIICSVVIKLPSNYLGRLLDLVVVLAEIPVVLSPAAQTHTAEHVLAAAWKMGENSELILSTAR